MRVGLLIAVLLLAPAVSGPAQTGGASGGAEEKHSYIYQWTDDSGAVHITDDLNKVPEQDRPRTRRLEAAPGAETAPTPYGKQSAAPSGGGAEEKLEAQQKAVWHQRISGAKQRLADAEQRYGDLKKRREALLGQWGTPAYAPPAARLEAEQLAQDMQRVQKEIDDARNELEVVIPEEARKAGVPPGWLRE